MSITTDIAAGIIVIKEKLPEHVKLIAVSKTHPVSAVSAAAACGQYIFGESKVQELLLKYKELPDMEWHFIGHLQTNKVSKLIGITTLIHSVDSKRLITEISSCSEKAGKISDCLLQLYIAKEETKYGLDESELYEILSLYKKGGLPGVRVCGLMGMASNTDDENTVRMEFRMLKQYFDRIKKDFFADKSYFCELSMGMSSDYMVAVEEGSTMVRIGSDIFGHREYK